MFVAYADCGTGGPLDPVLERHGVERLPGAHCYGFLAGNDAWDAIHEEEPATFYLTDFLARHFESLVVRGLKLDVHPELVPMMFGNYRRLVYLAQTDEPDLRSAPRQRPTSSAWPSRSAARGTASSCARLSSSSWASTMPELTVISWRGIPAQVTAGKGRGAARAQLSSGSRRPSTRPRCAQD